MTFRTSSTHWEIIINFMEENKDLAKGFLNGASGKERTKQLWEELTIQLNSAGLGEKSVIKWQKVRCLLFLYFIHLSFFTNLLLLQVLQMGYVCYPLYLIMFFLDLDRFQTFIEEKSSCN